MSACADLTSLKFVPESVLANNTLVGNALCITEATATGAGIEIVDEALDYETDLTEMWLIICGAMVFLMQAGFAMLEAGSVGSKNTINILFKNLLDAGIGAICFYLLGFGFAYGESAGGFIGTSLFAIFDDDMADAGNSFSLFFFQWAFAATAATIVSGSVAERTKFTAYFCYSIAITTFIYPVVVHWGWGSGWLSAWGAVDGPILKGDARSNGMIDFAGSGVVHMVGGFAGLVGAIVVGPRAGRFGEATKFFPRGKPVDMPGHSMVLCSLGVTLLWFGWYGFNAGSTLCGFTCMAVAAKVAVTTTLAAASASVTTAIVTKVVFGYYDLAKSLNAVIAGLVSITANCVVVDPLPAIAIGVIGAFVYLGSEYLLLALKIDDPLSACPLHGFCGIWGLLAVGIFATDENVQYAGYPNTNDAISRGEQFLVQVIGAAAILAWVLGTSTIVFVGIDKSIGMRVDEDVEEAGLDASEHGATAYKMT